MTPKTNSARVEWLERAWSVIREKLNPDAPETAALSVGFPSAKARSPKRRAIGECWDGWKKGEGNFISIHPCLFPNAGAVLETLVHEQIHATVGNKEGHKGKFVKYARAIGLEGKPTSTHAGPALAEKLREIAGGLGPIPEGCGDIFAAGNKQTTRLRKYVCPGCGQIIRAGTDSLKAVCGKCNKQFELKEGK